MLDLQRSFHFGSLSLVRTPYATVTVRVALGLALLALWACSQLQLPRLWHDSDELPHVPLSVTLVLDDTVRNATLEGDACGMPWEGQLDQALANALLERSAKTFRQVTLSPTGNLNQPGTPQADLTVQVSLINRGFTGSSSFGSETNYQAHLNVELLAIVYNAQGTPVGKAPLSYSKMMKIWTPEISGSGDGCSTHQLDGAMREAVEDLARQMVAAVVTAAGTSPAYAAAGAGYPQPAPFASSAPVVPAPPMGTNHQIPQGLSFRVLLQDQNQDGIFEGAEALTMQIEVANGGPQVAQGVTVSLSGAPPALIQQFQNPIPIGSLQVGERRQMSFTATVPADITEQQSELVIQVTEASGLAQPPPKRFIAWMRPGNGGGNGVEVLSVDVDDIPAKAPGFERKDMYAVVVGIGTYRGEQAPSVAYAKRDAEVVARYFETVAGIPKKNIRMLTDEYAVLGDLRDAFEHWLPQRVTRNSTVVVYVVGNGLARTSTGQIYVLPYEGRSGSRYRVYPLAHLLKALKRLPNKSTLLFFDLSFEAKAGASSRRLAWLNGEAARKGDTVIIASSAVPAQSIQFDRGQHGLFTYYLLKGLRGEADSDRNGSVSVNELYRFLRRRVPEATKAEGEKVRVPVMVPRLPVGSRLGSFHLGRSPDFPRGKR